jgi:hypothetical protein
VPPVWPTRELRSVIANLGKKGELSVARFRHEGREYKKSLKTREAVDSRAAMHCIERVIHALATGLIQIPAGVDAGDFIVSGGTLREARKPRPRTPALADLIDEYLGNLSHKAASSVYTEGVHLRNLKKQLGARADVPADRIVRRTSSNTSRLASRNGPRARFTRSVTRSARSSSGRSRTGTSTCRRRPG